MERQNHACPVEIDLLEVLSAGPLLGPDRAKHGCSSSSPAAVALAEYWLSGSYSMRLCSLPREIHYAKPPQLV